MKGGPEKSESESESDWGFSSTGTHYGKMITPSGVMEREREATLV